MTHHALEEQLLELRLSTFRNALREQRANPKYHDLPFEDRLSMLVEAETLQRCIQDVGVFWIFVCPFRQNP